MVILKKKVPCTTCQGAFAQGLDVPRTSAPAPRLGAAVAELPGRRRPRRDVREPEANAGERLGVSGRVTGIGEDGVLLHLRVVHRAHTVPDRDECRTALLVLIEEAAVAAAVPLDEIVTRATEAVELVDLDPRPELLGDELDHPEGRPRAGQVHIAVSIVSPLLVVPQRLDREWFEVNVHPVGRVVADRQDLDGLTLRHPNLIERPLSHRQVEEVYLRLTALLEGDAQWEIDSRQNTPPFPCLFRELLSLPAIEA